MCYICAKDKHVSWKYRNGTPFLMCDHCDKWVIWFSYHHRIGLDEYAPVDLTEPVEGVQQ